MKNIVLNKKAFFEYQIHERYVAGIELKGSEVKAIKASKVNIEQAYCLISDEAFIKNMYIIYSHT
jgi:SsrA-binding protein